jgi:RNA polymerase sigma factor (sigma-70 family)
MAVVLDVSPAPSPRVRRAAPQELGPLYEELRPDLMRFAEGLLGDRDDAEEAVHDAFAAAVRTGPLEEPRLWLFRVTRNAAVSQLRARRRVVPFEVVEGAASTAPTPQQRVELAEEVEVLRAGIDRLGEQQRAALLLRELAGCSYREIGDVLHVSEANVKILIYRARRGLESYRAAAQLPCEDARLALSAAHDGEGGRAAAARARLHTAGCSGCRRFAGALKDQRVAFAMLVPALPVDVDGVVHAAANHVGDVVQAASSHLLHHVPLATGGGAGGAGAVGGLLGLKGAAATTAAVMTVGAGGVAVVHPGPVPDIVPRIVGAPDADRGVPAPDVARTPKAVALGTADAASEALPWGLAWERGGLVPGEDIVRQIRLPDGTTRTVVVTVPLGTPEGAAVSVPAPAAPEAPAPIITDPAVLPLPEAPPAEEVPPVTEAPPDDGVLVPVDPADPVDPPGRDEVPVDPVGEGDDGEEPGTEEPVAEEPADEEPAAEEPVGEEPADEDPLDEEPVDEEPVDEPPVDEAAPAGEDPVENIGDDGSPADVPAAPADVVPAVAEDPPAVVADDAPSVDGGATPAAVQAL